MDALLAIPPASSIKRQGIDEVVTLGFSARLPLYDRQSFNARTIIKSEAAPNPIKKSSAACAVVSITYRWPGADNLMRFWSNLIQKKISIAPIPKVRVDEVEYVQVYGGFIEITQGDLQDFGFSSAHSKLSDPMESTASAQDIASLPKARWAIGAVKATIGHTLGASGMAGFMEASLGSDHHCLLPQPEKVILNPRYRFTSLPVYLLDKPQHLDKEPIQYFGVNAFGFGGTMPMSFYPTQYKPSHSTEVISWKKILKLSHNERI
jgi:acyl transferase domain-containing protein